MKRSGTAGAVILAASLAAAGLAAAEAAGPAGGTPPADWPQFHGPNRDNISTETGLLKRWPEGGPKLLWRATGIGAGYTSVAISGRMIYTAGNIGKHTVITAMDMAGKALWRAKNGPAYRRAHPGARGTPTIDEGKVYHLNADGDVLCLDAKTGKHIWTLNMLKKFGGRNISWALAESVLIDGRNLICTPGGKNISMVALDKKTGKTVWTCRGAGDKPGYASPILVHYKGLRQIVTMMSPSVVGVAADTGRLLWRYPCPAKFDENILTPVFHDGYVFVSIPHGRGATLLKLNVEGNRCSAKRTWHTKDLDNKNGGVMLVGGYLYGHASSRPRWVCLEFKTGRTMYSVPGLPGACGTLTYADGMLYLLSERGAVALMRPDPKGFAPVSRFQLPRGPRQRSWAHPVVCRGRLYIRHWDVLYAYDARRK